MKKIGLIVGETTALPKEIIEKQGMVSVPYIVNWEEGKNLPGENLFQRMRESSKQNIKGPKTSQPSPFTFKKIFEKELQNSEGIICITLSSKISGGYNSACQGKKMLSESEQKRVYIIDSLNVSSTEGLFALKAADLIKTGKNIEEIVKELKEFIPKLHLIGMLEDPKWLEANGRLSHTLAVLIKQMQKIGMRPLLKLKDGVVKAANLKMQAKDMSAALFKELKKNTEGKKIKVAIVHADNLEEAEKLKKIINNELKEAEIIFLNLIDSIIGVHIGPGAVICSWYSE